MATVLLDASVDIRKVQDLLPAQLIWVPLCAKTYIEDGQLKAECPECGHITTFRHFDKMIAYVCEGCGLGINVQE
jgi:hypothetical protein